MQQVTRSSTSGNRTFPKAAVPKAARTLERAEGTLSVLFVLHNKGLSACQVGSGEHGDIPSYRRLGRNGPRLGCGRHGETAWPARPRASLNRRCCARIHGACSASPCRCGNPGWPQAPGDLVPVTVFLPFCQVCQSVLGSGGSALLQTCPPQREAKLLPQRPTL